MDMAADTKLSGQFILSIAVAVLTVILRISQPSSTLSWIMTPFKDKARWWCFPWRKLIELNTEKKWFCEFACLRPIHPIHLYTWWKMVSFWYERSLLTANQHYCSDACSTSQQQKHRALNPTTKDDKISVLFMCHRWSDVFPTNVNNQQEAGRDTKKPHKVQARLSPAFSHLDSGLLFIKMALNRWN